MSLFDELNSINQELQETIEGQANLRAYEQNLRMAQKKLLSRAIFQAHPALSPKLQLVHDVYEQHGCPSSPTKLCVYLGESDPWHEHCIYCQLPEERD